MAQIHPQLGIFSVLPQQRTHECLVFRCRAPMASMLQAKLRYLGELGPETFCQIDGTAPRRQFTVPTEV